MLPDWMCESYVVWRLAKEDPKQYLDLIRTYAMLEILEFQVLKRTAFYMDTEKPYFKKDDDDD